MKNIFIMSIFALSIGILLLKGQTFAQSNDDTLAIVTLAPAREYCDSTKSSECYVMTFTSNNMTVKTDKPIVGFEFKKGNTYTLQLRVHNLASVITNPSDTSFILVNEISRTFNPNICTNKTYNDGCNSCTILDNNQTTCTAMACLKAGVPSCSNDVNLLLYPTVCTTEYSPVCDITGKIYGNSCLAKKAGLAGDQYSHGYCVDPTITSLSVIERAYSNGIIKYNTVADFMGNNYILRADSAKEFTVFAKLYENHVITETRTYSQCVFTDNNGLGTEVKYYTALSCRYGLLMGYKKMYMPNLYLTKGQTKIVLTRIIGGDDTKAQSVLNNYFAESDLNQPISKIELIKIMQNVYYAHLGNM